MDNRMSLLTSPFVPEGMLDLMKKLSKEVIKERPSNIYEHAAVFFEKMLIERDGSLDKGYGKFRSYSEYCKFIDKMDQRRLSNEQIYKEHNQPKVISTNAEPDTDTQDKADPVENIVVQGVAIQGVERKSKDDLKNVSMNPKYMSDKAMKSPVVANVKNVKVKPRKLSSKKPSKNLIVIKEETSADVDDNGNGESIQHKAAMAIQKAYRTYLSKKGINNETPHNVSQMSEDTAALIIQKAFKSLVQKMKYSANDIKNDSALINADGHKNDVSADEILNKTANNSEQILLSDENVDAIQDPNSEVKNKVNGLQTLTDLAPTENESPADLETAAGVHTTEEFTESESAPKSHEETSSQSVTSPNQDKTSLLEVSEAAEMTSTESKFEEDDKSKTVKRETHVAELPNEPQGNTISDNIVDQRDQLSHANEASIHPGQSNIETNKKEIQESPSDAENLPQKINSETLERTAEELTVSDAVTYDREDNTKYMEGSQDILLTKTLSFASKPSDTVGPAENQHELKDSEQSEVKEVELSAENADDLGGKSNNLKSDEQPQDTKDSNQSEVIEEQLSTEKAHSLEGNPDNMKSDESQQDPKDSTQSEVIEEQLSTQKAHNLEGNPDNMKSDKSQQDTKDSNQSEVIEDQLSTENGHSLGGNPDNMKSDENQQDSKDSNQLGAIEDQLSPEHRHNLEGNPDNLESGENQDGSKDSNQSEVIAVDLSTETAHNLEGNPDNMKSDENQQDSKDSKQSEVIEVQLSKKNTDNLEGNPDNSDEKQDSNDRNQSEVLEDQLSTETASNIEDNPDNLKSDENQQDSKDSNQSEIIEAQLSTDNARNHDDNPENLKNDENQQDSQDSNQPEVVEVQLSRKNAYSLGDNSDNLKSEENQQDSKHSNRSEIIEVAHNLEGNPDNLKSDENQHDSKDSNQSEIVEVHLSTENADNLKDNPDNLKRDEKQQDSKDSNQSEIIEIQLSTKNVDNLEGNPGNLKSEDNKQDSKDSNQSEVIEVQLSTESAHNLEDNPDNLKEDENQQDFKNSNQSEVTEIQVSTENAHNLQENVGNLKNDKNKNEFEESNQIEVKEHQLLTESHNIQENPDNLKSDENQSKVREDQLTVEIKDELQSNCKEEVVINVETSGPDRKDNKSPIEGVGVDEVDQTKEDQNKPINDTTEDGFNEGKNVESREDQLFVVEKDGVYVNIDLLQEKLGSTALVDDGVGDSEKSFKLNILENEEILVNQENVQQIKSQNRSEDILDTGNRSGDILEKEETDEDPNFDYKDEEAGNEEYELAETVVLVDIPSKHKTNDQIRATAADIESLPLDKAKINSDEADNIESKATNEYNFGKTTEPAKDDDAPKIKTHPEATEEEESINLKNVNEDTKALGVQVVSTSEDALKEKNNDEHEITDQLTQVENDKSKEIVKETTEQIDDENKIAKNDANSEIVAQTMHNSESVTSKPNETDESDKKLEVADKRIAPNDKGCADVKSIESSKPETRSETKNDQIDSDIESESHKESLEVTLEKKEDELLEKDITTDVTTNETQARNSIEKNVELAKAATIIQKVFRGYIVRNSGRVQANNKKDQLELAAAIILQKYMRGFLARRKLQKDKPNKIVAELNETNDSVEDPSYAVATQMPDYSNRFLIPKDSFLERESFADDEDYAKACKELAATSIQKTFRGYRVRRSLKASSETDNVSNEIKDEGQSSEGNDEIETAVNEANRVISAVLDVATDVLPSGTYDPESIKDVVNEELPDKTSSENKNSSELSPESVLGQIVHDNVHVEGQMQQKYNKLKFKDIPINPIEEMSDSSEHPETPRVTKAAVVEFDSLDSKRDESSKSFSYEQLSSDLSDTDTGDMKKESLKESEVDGTSRDERDDLSEVENFDLSSCGEDSLEAMYYSIRKNEIMLDRMQKQVTEQRDQLNNENGTTEKRVEFPERVTENLEVTMQQVFKSLESSSDCDTDKKDEDDNSSTLDLGLDDSSSINDEKEVETSRQIIKAVDTHPQDNNESEPVIHSNNDSNVDVSTSIKSSSSDERNEAERNSDDSFNSSVKFIMKSQSVSEEMMNPIMFAMRQKETLLDQMHVRRHPLPENPSEDHDAFPEHLLTDIDIGNIQRKIFASSVSETDSDYVEPTTKSRRLLRDDFNISTALDHMSTDSDSTIVSAATKIQAGARGFLTRRRLRRSSAGGTSISFEKRYSFGNAAIDKSLEDLIKRQEQINLDGAALKIQQQYRRYQARKNNLEKVSPIREQKTLELSNGSSGDGAEETNDIVGIREVTLAQKKVDDVEKTKEESTGTHPISLNVDTVITVEPVKRTPVNQRRLTLQRGDAVQRNSRPDSQELNAKEPNLGTQTFKDSETGECAEPIFNKKEKKVTANINIQSLINRGIGPRQRSMPVQIDSDLIRIIPKHLRKRVKSAEISKKKMN